ncbi:hypothetical protein H1Q59_05615 [Holosporaceae bacterium 'Namur']|nr:hypothetical protein [Holosporaceae bacterium 'Namur']
MPPIPTASAPGGIQATTTSTVGSDFNKLFSQASERNNKKKKGGVTSWLENTFGGITDFLKPSAKTMAMTWGVLLAAAMIFFPPAVPLLLIMGLFGAAASISSQSVKLANSPVGQGIGKAISGVGQALSAPVKLIDSLVKMAINSKGEPQQLKPDQQSVQQTEKAGLAPGQRFVTPLKPLPQPGQHANAQPIGQSAIPTQGLATGQQFPTPSKPLPQPGQQYTNTQPVEQSVASAQGLATGQQFPTPSKPLPQPGQQYANTPPVEQSVASAKGLTTGQQFPTPSKPLPQPGQQHVNTQTIEQSAASTQSQVTGQKFSTPSKPLPQPGNPSGTNIPSNVTAEALTAIKPIESINSGTSTTSVAGNNQKTQGTHVEALLRSKPTGGRQI